MKKLKYFILVLCLILGVGTLLYVPNSFSVSASDNIHTINFYDYTKTKVIATYEVENGKRLSDYDNNLLKNGDFFSNSNGKMSYVAPSGKTVESVDNWYTNVNGTVNVIDSGINYVTTNIGVLYQDLSVYYGNNNISVSTKINGVFYSMSGFIPLDKPSITTGEYAIVNIPFNISSVRVGYIKFVYQYSTNNLRAYYYILSNNNIDIDYFKVEIGSTATPYFSESYLRRLFNNSFAENDLEYNLYWSKSGSSGMRYLFDTVVTEDIDLYPVVDYTPPSYITYKAELSQDNTLLPDYAIKSIERCELTGRYDYRITFDLTENSYGLDFLYLTTGTNNVFISGNYTDIAFTINSLDSNIKYFKDNFYMRIQSKTTGGIKIVASDNLAIIYLKNGYEYVMSFGVANVVLVNNALELLPVSIGFLEDLQLFCDMSSDKIPSFELLNLDDNNIFVDLYNFKNGYSFPQNLSFNVSKCFVDKTSLNTTNMLLETTSLNAFREFADFSTNNFYFYLDNVNFRLYMPYYRLNSTLVLYNYDYAYSYLNYCNGLTYSLRRGNDFYKIKWGYEVDPYTYMPNNYFNMFYCSQIQNTIFDEYIDLQLDYVSYIRGESGFEYKDNKVLITFPFDFNFVNYAQPLVASNGAYNFDFEKPEYVEMNFSLNPFYIPVLEFCQNAIIFLVFYCPVISDILDLLHLNRFVSGILTVINFVKDSPVGVFVYACIGFFIFFAMIKSFMPVIYRINANSKASRYNMEMKESKKEFRYQKYKDKRIKDNYNAELKERQIKQARPLIKQAKKNARKQKYNVQTVIIRMNKGGQGDH